jgi:hypothetical protein
MDMLMAGLGTLMNAFFLALIVAGVMKLFQIHSTLNEIKEQLGKSPSYAPPLPRVPSYQAPSALSPAAASSSDMRSGEEMLRDLDAQMRLEETRRTGPRL